jgi:putative selenium metabolism protein SsnA
MGIVITNALLLDLDPPGAEPGELRIDGEHIAARGARLERRPGDEVVDAGGAVVLPGLVNGHTHLYSALATGMPPPARAPANFHEILKLVWWRLDQALDAESIEVSARIGALDALHCGTTLLIDHHASPQCIEGALDRVEKGIAAAGLRGLLCYETTDRHGLHGRELGLLENDRYLRKFAEQRSRRFAGLVGAHASFTLHDETLRELARMAERFSTGVHVHVAEDPCDEDFCAEQEQMALVDRLANHGLLQPEAIFAHCTHLDDEAIDRVSAAGLTVAHNARSNMNNAVGYAPVGRLRCPVMLGTDGIGQDMFAEVRAAWFMSRHGRTGLTPQVIVGMLAAAARRASEALDLTLGKLEPGAAADIVVTDYLPATPLHAGNVAGHLLFGLQARHVKDVLIDGHWMLRERRVLALDEAEVRRAAAGVAADLWKRMEKVSAR